MCGVGQSQRCDRRNSSVAEHASIQLEISRILVGPATTWSQIDSFRFPPPARPRFRPFGHFPCLTSQGRDGVETLLLTVSYHDGRGRRETPGQPRVRPCSRVNTPPTRTICERVSHMKSSCEIGAWWTRRLRRNLTQADQAERSRSPATLITSAPCFFRLAVAHAAMSAA
jgi:hypothetical protein